MRETHSKRAIRSFVRRQGRLTSGQQKALAKLGPKFLIEEDTSLLELDSLFNRIAPRVLEIGFGNGLSLAQMAEQQSEQDFLGVEVHRPGVGQLLQHIEQRQLQNVRVACTDAVELLKYRIADNSLNRIQLFFPDPWHKKRHHKRRIIQPSFVALMAKKLKAGGYLHLATDWRHYADQMLSEISDNPCFQNCAEFDFIPRPAYRPLTKFELRGQKLGHGVWDLLFKCEKTQIIEDLENL